MSKKEHCIYIMTNKSFPDWVKIGYSDDVQKRLDQLNSHETTPFAFELYAYYKVGEERLADLHIHRLIDDLNPDLRSIDTVNGKMRKREFFKMPPERAYGLLAHIASINGLTDNLILVNNNKPDAEMLDEQPASYSDTTERLSHGVRDVYDYFMDMLDGFSDVEVLNKKGFQGINYRDSRIANINFFRSKFTLLVNPGRLSDLTNVKNSNCEKYRGWGQFYAQIDISDKAEADRVLKVLIDSYHIR